MRIIVSSATGSVVMYSEIGRPEPAAGQEAYDLSEAQAAEFAALLSQPNSGVTFDGSAFTAGPPLPTHGPTPPLSDVAVASPAQFRRELRAMDKLDAVKALLATLDPATQDDFDYATEFRSDSPKLLALAAHPAVGLSEQDVKDALTRASLINIGAL